MIFCNHCGEAIDGEAARPGSTSNLCADCEEELALYDAVTGTGIAVYSGVVQLDAGDDEDGGEFAPIHEYVQP